MAVRTATGRYTDPTSRGGGLKSVELLDYPETISACWLKEGQSSADGFATLNARTPVPVLAILGGTNLVGDGNFSLGLAYDLTRHDQGVIAKKLLPNGLRLAKEFYLSSNYLVEATVRLINTSDKPLALPAQEFVVGAAMSYGRG